MKTGDEPLQFGGKAIGQRLIDFWRWSASDLLDNTLRGTYSEFIVGSALGLDLSVGREEWAAWDLTYPFQWKDGEIVHDEVHIEVKSSAYLQSWEQKRPSNIVFSIRPTRAWMPDSGYQKERRRQSDLYIFCLYTETAREKANPLVLDVWRFFLLPTRQLDASCGEQKVLSLSSLKKLMPVETNYAGMRRAVEMLMLQA